MAEAAGHVNLDGLAGSAAFMKVLETKPEEIRQLAIAVRRLVYDVLPQTLEVVWPRQGSVGWGTGPKKFTEQFAYLLCHTKHVTLGFYRGGELADPMGLLPESDKQQVGGSLSMRSLKLTSIDDVQQPALRSLLAGSTRHGVPPPST